MTTSEPEQTPDEEGDPPPEPTGRHGWRLAKIGVIFALLAYIIKTNYVLVIDTTSDLVILGAFVIVLTWATDIYYQWWQTKRRPRRAFVSAAATIILALLLAVVGQPPVRALHHHHCRFGTFGVGWGNVWIEVEPMTERDQAYTLSVDWGPVQTQDIETLNRTTYFTLQKNNLYSPDTAGISVEPSAYLSCGNGDPPLGAPRVELTRWHPKTPQPSPSTSK